MAPVTFQLLLHLCYFLGHALPGKLQLVRPERGCRGLWLGRAPDRINQVASKMGTSSLPASSSSFFRVLASLTCGSTSSQGSPALEWHFTPEVCDAGSCSLQSGAV